MGVFGCGKMRRGENQVRLHVGTRSVQAKEE